MWFSQVVQVSIATIPPLLAALVAFLWRVDRRIYRIELLLKAHGIDARDEKDAI